jgi:hypothetical protein
MESTRELSQSGVKRESERKRRTVERSFPPQTDFVLSLRDLSSSKGNLDALLLLVDLESCRRTSRLRLELTAAEDGGFEDERVSSVKDEGGGGLGDVDGDLSGSGKGEGLKVGTDGEVVVGGAVEVKVSGGSYIR